MAVSDFFNNIPFQDFFGGDILRTGLLFVGIGVFAFIAIEVAARNRRAFSGSWGYRRTEREEGLGRYGRAMRRIEQLEEALRQREKALAATLASQESQTQEKSSKEAVRASKEGAIAAIEEEALEEFATALEARVIDAIASIKKIARAIIDYAYRQRNEVLTEEQSEGIIDSIMADLSSTINYAKIDDKVRYHIIVFINRLIAYFRQDVSMEKNKEVQLSALVEQFEEAIDTMKKAVSDAGLNLKRVRREGRKERKYFKREFGDLRASIRAKRRELISLYVTKGSDPALIASLRQEISLLRDYLNRAKAIKSQLDATYSFMKSELRQMKRLLRFVRKNEGDMKGYERVLEERKKQIDKRLKSLEEAFSSIERIPPTLSAANPHEIAKVLSSRLKIYFPTYHGILDEDLGFNTAVRDITVKNLVISQQIAAFQRLESSLRQTEKAVETGVEALTQLLKGVLGEASAEASIPNVDEIIQTLKNSRSIIDYQGNVESFMQNLLQTLKARSRQLTADLQFIIDQTNLLIEKVKAHEQRSASHLGVMIATSVQRKIGIGQMTMAESDALDEELQKRNESVASAYRQAMAAEQLAAAT